MLLHPPEALHALFDERNKLETGLGGVNEQISEVVASMLVEILQTCHPDGMPQGIMIGRLQEACSRISEQDVLVAVWDLRKKGRIGGSSSHCILTP